MADKLAKAEWAEYRLGDLFDPIKRGDIFKQKELIAKSDGVAFIAQNESDNGFVDLVDAENYRQFAGGAIVVGRQTGAVYYQPETFVTTDGVLVLQNDILKKRSAGMAIASAIRKNMFRFSYTNTVSAAKLSDINIKLPVVNGEIDFEFMENFVAELEAQRVAELEAHLTVTGQKNYILTEEEKSALRSCENIEWKKFKLDTLFEKLKTKKLTYKAGELPKQATGAFNLPSLTSSFRNQGLNYFVPKDGATVLKNVISLPSNSDVYRAYYQSQEFTVLSDSYAIDWIFNSTKLSPKQYLFAVSSINKVTDLATYSYKNKLGGWNVVSKKSILLPVKNDEIDFAYMETLISAVQKLVIKDVVIYADEKIAATKRVIGKES